MYRLELDGKWFLRRVGDDEPIEARVPGSVFADLLAAGKIEDPYYRENEIRAKEIALSDYEYTRDFEADECLLSHERIILRCEGLDTLAEISINGGFIAATNNMHRIYEFDIKSMVRPGRNNIRIIFRSPVRYVAEKQAENPLWGANDAIAGFPHIRKCHSMFGWDWGPQIPDSGIWRSICVLACEAERIEDVYVTQEHCGGGVKLDVGVRIGDGTCMGDCGGGQDYALNVGHGGRTAISSKAGDLAGGNKKCETGKNAGNKTRGETGGNIGGKPGGSPGRLRLRVELTAPDGSIIGRTVDVSGGEEHIPVHIGKPALWWPNGLGDHPLYHIKVELLDMGKSMDCPDNAVLDRRFFRIGLRTIEVRRQKDCHGESFEFVVNGIPIFAKGANYIPEDSILPRCSRERTEKLVKSCVEANFNILRVWGGGIYPWDYFYDLCDEYGILVWQDFMFACAVYELSDEFAENIAAEARDNVKRIRHHACLALWCGNNEMETGWANWNFPKTERHRGHYIDMFEKLLPGTVAEHDPNTFYWPSSPSSGGGFDNPNDENRGDVHYWDVWHGLKPFSDYRNHFFRFVSEFGFQSFPAMKTVKTFTLPSDRNIFSYVMENHQKNGSANGRILYYISENFKYPKDFESLLLTSQILQAEAIRCGVEHWRSNRGRCMGAIYWQLNDCWPVASWSSIDYYGRWKALHYFARKFFAPVLLSACEKGTGAALSVSNDTRRRISGEARWKLRDNRSHIIAEGAVRADVPPLSAKTVCELDFGQYLSDRQERRRIYLEYGLYGENGCISCGTLLFVRCKHFEFIDPEIEISAEEREDAFLVGVKAGAYAKYVNLDLESADCVFEDNFFDLSAGVTRKIAVKKDSLPLLLTLDEFKSQLKARSIYDLA